MAIDRDIDVEYLKDCLQLTPEERFVQCIDFMEFSAKFNQHLDMVLENDHPEIFQLK